ncbi:hypothetical protein FLCU109888_11475 [Flavobacterium cucumis]|uniref:Uncharacterized protein n=1 Tax=Flavobacterium cucumis TaxID=416016 RepID=A0A1M7ZVG2_9FLAO|nr:hypothetical protein [Flavobacterium cucumis]SHO72871.1 hypothetical protein SAMN05443547_1215 [Flavobacterium cucumis]
MKNKIFNFFKELFIEQIKAFALSNFPLQVTNQTKTFHLIKIKKGRIREIRVYDINHKRVFNFRVLQDGNILIKP